MSHNTPTTPFYQPIIDCDIHNELPSLKTLMPYLEEHWVAYITNRHLWDPMQAIIPREYPHLQEKAQSRKMVRRGLILNC